MAATDSEPNLTLWIGRRETRHDVLEPNRIAAMAATLDVDAPLPGDPLPYGWHWLFFNPMVRRREIGSDGHPRRGSFLPPVALPRRMWASGRLKFLAPLPIGAAVERQSEILSVQVKDGRSGRLVFVTVRHRHLAGGALVIDEEQDIVYREAGGGAAKPPEAPEEPGWSETVEPDPVLLFRYSALTYNGHRIHYDTPYARNEEGYPDLVVHGPLTATLLMGAATARAGRPLAGFGFRGTSPLFVDAPFRLCGRAADADGKMDLWVEGANSSLAMIGSADLGVP